MIVASYVDVAVGCDRGVAVSVQVVLKFGFVHRRSLPCVFFFRFFPLRRPRVGPDVRGGAEVRGPAGVPVSGLGMALLLRPRTAAPAGYYCSALACRSAASLLCRVTSGFSGRSTTCDASGNAGASPWVFAST